MKYEKEGLKTDVRNLQTVGYSLTDNTHDLPLVHSNLGINRVLIVRIRTIQTSFLQQPSIKSPPVWIFPIFHVLSKRPFSFREAFRRFYFQIDFSDRPFKSSWPSTLFLMIVIFGSYGVRPSDRPLQSSKTVYFDK